MLPAEFDGVAAPDAEIIHQGEREPRLGADRMVIFELLYLVRRPRVKAFRRVFLGLHIAGRIAPQRRRVSLDRPTEYRRQIFEAVVRGARLTVLAVAQHLDV